VGASIGRATQGEAGPVKHPAARVCHKARVSTWRREVLTMTNGINGELAGRTHGVVTRDFSNPTALHQRLLELEARVEHLEEKAAAAATAAPTGPPTGT
jgi:hypothetical protein